VARVAKEEREDTVATEAREEKVDITEELTSSKKMLAVLAVKSFVTSLTSLMVSITI